MMSGFEVSASEQTCDGTYIVSLGFRDVRVPKEVIDGPPITEFILGRLATEVGVNLFEITPDFLDRYHDESGESWYGRVHVPEGHQHLVTPEQAAKITRFAAAHPLQGVISLRRSFLGEPQSWSFIKPFSHRMADYDRHYVEDLMAEIHHSKVL
jgi:hypothetical protein